MRDKNFFFGRRSDGLRIKGEIHVDGSEPSL